MSKSVVGQKQTETGQISLLFTKVGAAKPTKAEELSGNEFGYASMYTIKLWKYISVGICIY